MSSNPVQSIERKVVADNPGYERSARPLAEWRNAGAYVLLAEPGAGKTEAFKREALATPGNNYVTARDFVTLSAEKYLGRAPLYIDGLDEIRAGSISFNRPLDSIRSRLDELGRPAFRLSCREADWRSAVDQDQLRAVAPGQQLAVLHLVELNEQEIAGILQDKGVRDPAQFLEISERQGIRPLLGNPLLLDLMVRAVGRDPSSWPASRSAIYLAACRQLATEQNEEHRAEYRDRLPSVDKMLEEAGLLCALYLLAGQADLQIDRLPMALTVENARMTLSSKLFVGDSESRFPRHRTIAEFLAARALSSRITKGLPVNRVLALMSGSDGGIVDPLRGLHAWLAAQCKPERARLIGNDPLGIVLYGDLGDFSGQEKLSVLHALHAEAKRYPWFRKGHWYAQPFGALGTRDMTEHFRRELSLPDRSESHQSYLQCVLEAIEYGEPMPGIEEGLRVLVRDDTFMPHIRADALDAWLGQCDSPSGFLALLDDIEINSVSDPDDELAGRLLRRLYPRTISPAEVLRYFHPLKRESFHGRYQDFWSRCLVSATPRESLDVLMNAWVAHPRPDRGHQQSSISNKISCRLLEEALSTHGDKLDVESLYRWLGVALDKHGFVRMSDEKLERVRLWLSARPSVLKTLVAYGWSQVAPEVDSGRRHYWRVEGRTVGATRPSDWYVWLLEQAAQTDDEELARYCFASAAHVAINPLPGFAVTMEEVEEWVERNRVKWHTADDWLQEAWSMPLNHCEAEHKRDQKQHQDKEQSQREKRRRDLAKHLSALKDGSAHPALLNQIALAYDGRYYDIRGATELERVIDFLGGVSEEEARAVIAGQERTLRRSDLPSIEDILKIGLKGRTYYIGAACRLGAKLAFLRDPGVVAQWSDELTGKLAAFWLTEGVGDEPDWYQSLAARRSSLVAPIMVRFAAQRLKKRGESHIPGLWHLARDDRFAELARLVVPDLLRTFPRRADEPRLRVLNGELLPAAREHLPNVQYAALVSGCLKRRNIDAAQRISYLVAGLLIDGPKYSAALLRIVGSSEANAAHLGRAIEWQGDRRKGLPPLPATVLGRLIELIAPYASPERPTGAHWVSDADRRRDWVHQFINQLASDPSIESQAELKRLVANPRFNAWKSSLQGAIFDQSKVRRESAFRLASVEDVANVLANRSPANAQDLCALVLDQLSGLEARLRGDETNGLRVFYKDDRRTPRAENDCRDAILQCLRPPLLVLGVDIEKEGQTKGDKRVDLRLKIIQPGRAFSVPIEIKLDSHRELWSAWRSQLLQYMQDPSSSGIGIYLVLWFGQKPRSSPYGKKPGSPAELRRMLSNQIPEDLRNRLRVEVVDLSLSATT